MSTRDHAIMGNPCWIDLMTTDVDTARTFYSELFSWEAGEASSEFGGYFMFTRDGAPIAGAMPIEPGGPIPNVWSTYLAVTDVAEAVARAEAAGATVAAPVVQIADLGAMAVLIDPVGAAIGLWQPIQFQGFSVIDEPRAPRWFELHARDHDRAVTFYREAFSWDTREMSGETHLRYTTANNGDEGFAGLMDAVGELPEGVPSYWLVYFGVENVDASLEIVRARGGAVLSPAVDTPFGRMAGVADPSGAIFTILQS
ncbi:MAG TPA: VOC family protein [Acidimicrobiales bacterium]|nr:VOC family protein [Acidimicrobiales bacterium]